MTSEDGLAKTVSGLVSGTWVQAYRLQYGDEVGMGSRVALMTWVPEACTLPTAEHPVRLAEFDDLLAMAIRPTERVGPTELRIRLPAGDEVASKAQELATRETRCCSFFGFDVRASRTDTVLIVGVPDSQSPVLDAMHERAEAARLRGARP